MSFLHKHFFAIYKNFDKVKHHTHKNRYISFFLISKTTLISPF